MPRAMRGFVGAIFEQLESRVLLSFDPTAQEQQMLELINRMRTNPGPELDILLNAHDAAVDRALGPRPDGFGVNIPNLRNQWVQLQAVPPVAWNESLYYAALAHSKTMVKYRQQSHQVDVPANSARFVEADLRGRASAQGYTDNSYIGENVYAYAESVFHAHAAFSIDWGNTPSGIQVPPGHRDTLMDTDPNVPIHYREVGIGIFSAPAGNDGFGPLVVTQDFGAPVDAGNGYLLGTISNDINGNGAYDPGEGVGGIHVHIAGTGGTFDTTSMTAGGWQVRVPAGTYTVSAMDGSTVLKSQSNVVVGSNNVMADFNTISTPDVIPPTAALVPLARITRGGAKTFSFTVNYSDDRLVNLSTIGKGDIIVYTRNGFKQTAALSKVLSTVNAASIRAIYRIKPPGGKWDSSDNGRYYIKVQPRHVKDISGNAVASTMLGSFVVKIARKRVRSASPAALADAAPSTASAPRVIDPTGAFSTRRIADVLSARRMIFA